MTKDSYSFSDFKYDPSSFSADAFTAPEASSLYSNIFGNSAPSYDFNSYKFDTAFSPDTITRAFTPASSSRSSGTDWLGTLGKGLEALSKARSYQQYGSSGSSRRTGSSGSNAGVVSRGKSWTMYVPAAKQTTKQSGGGGGIGGAVGTLAGITASFIPGIGPAAVAAMPAAGGALGSLFG
jgi:hypothetical protein